VRQGQTREQREGPSAGKEGLVSVFALDLYFSRLLDTDSSLESSSGWMKVVVLYFAALRELLGISEETIVDVSGPLSVHAFAGLLGQRHPVLVPHLSSVRFAVNESFVAASDPIEDGDTVALIPPVSGG
jgi:molybdopterin converting factor subunit 1